MKLCKDCMYFIDANKRLDPSIFETRFVGDKCDLFYKIEPVRGLRVNAFCEEARSKPSMCGPEAIGFR